MKLFEEYPQYISEFKDQLGWNVLFYSARYEDLKLFDFLLERNVPFKSLYLRRNIYVTEAAIKSKSNEVFMHVFAKIPFSYELISP